MKTYILIKHLANEEFGRLQVEFLQSSSQEPFILVSAIVLALSKTQAS